MIWTTGIPAALALPTTPWTAGVEFWELKTNTRISLFDTCSSTVTLSAALGSVPSLIAFR